MEKEEPQLLVLKEQVTELQKELDSVKRNRLRTLSQEEVFGNIIEHAVSVYKDYQEKSLASDTFSLEKEADNARLELETINKLDRRDKWYKGIMLSICIGALIISAFWDKLQNISPVIGVIIGLLLKSNIISEYYAGSRGKFDDKQE